MVMVVVIVIVIASSSTWALVVVVAKTATAIVANIDSVVINNDGVLVMVGVNSSCLSVCTAGWIGNP